MKNKIIEDIKSAMKSQDKVALAVVRMLKSDIQMAELNKKSELTDDEIVSIVSKQIKMRKDSIKEFEKGNSNTSQLLDWFQDEEVISHITEIMAGDFEITDVNKAIDDLISIYEKEKLISRRNEILKKLESVSEAGSEEVKELEKELNDIILKLAKIK